MEAGAACAHETCRCTRPYDKKNLAMSVRPTDPNATYCSVRCEQQASGQDTSDACECGHPQCTPQQTPDLPPI